MAVTVECWHLTHKKSYSSLCRLFDNWEEKDNLSLKTENKFLRWVHEGHKIPEIPEIYEIHEIHEIYTLYETSKIYEK